jgi:hypothetical protein
VKLVRTSFFDKSLKKLGASDADIAKLMASIVAQPGAGDVIPGLEGARKLRFAMKGRGKSGGGRAIYLVTWKDDTAYLLLAYSKSEQADLSEAQRAMVMAVIKQVSDG